MSRASLPHSSPRKPQACVSQACLHTSAFCAIRPQKQAICPTGIESAPCPTEKEWHKSLWLTFVSLRLLLLPHDITDASLSVHNGICQCSMPILHAQHCAGHVARRRASCDELLVLGCQLTQPLCLCHYLQSMHLSQALSVPGLIVR